MPAVAGLVPDQIVHAIAAYLDFCYLVRLPSFKESDLNALHDTLARFTKEKYIFVETGVRPKGISLPRQHAIQHFPRLIKQFGAPNGHCSSITESLHKDAIKGPWHRTNKHEALGQILVINCRMDNMEALHVQLATQGLQDRPLVPEGVELQPMDSESEGPRDDVEASERFEAIVELAKSPGING